MKYKIVKTELDIPIKVNILTDKGIVESSNSIDGTIFPVESGVYTWTTKSGVYTWLDLKPIVISLQEISELPDVADIPISDNKEFEMKFRENADATTNLARVIKDKIDKSLKTIKCSLDLQVILLEKLDKGINITND